MPTSHVVGHPNDLNGQLTWSNPRLSNSCYIPSTKSNNHFLNDDSFKLTGRTVMTVQNRYEEIESLEPFTETRPCKTFDSLLVQDDPNHLKSTNKESLVVEIKEADSEESAQHSPCPDNTKVDNVQKDQDKPPTGVDVEEKLEPEEEQKEEDSERRPSLIRRNTFELDANDEKLSSLRQEYERRQGNLVFQNSITQYSQHRIDQSPDAYFDVATQPHSVIVNDSDPEAEPQLPLIFQTCNVAKDKYDLDTAQKERKPTRLFANVNDEAAMHSISRSASDKLLSSNDDDDDISYASLPVTINDELGITPAKVLPKLRRSEAAPIVSGGASSSDYKKPTDSPVVKRKTESTPIVSGGFVHIPEPQAKDRSKAKKALNLSSAMAAWVVDMSDCQTSVPDKSSPPKKTKDPRAAMSSSFSPLTNNPEPEDKAQHSSLGYFVNLDDVKSPKGHPKEPFARHRRRQSDTASSEKNYCEFFVDLSDKSATPKSEPPKRAPEPPDPVPPSQASDSKKNMFSMFIDLSEPIAAPNRGVAKSNSSSKLADKRYELAQKRADSELERKPKSGVFMFIESDSPLVRRRTLSSSRPGLKRHSWNSDKSQQSTPASEQLPAVASPPVVNQQPAGKLLHKRAHSLSADRSGDFRKLFGQHRSSTSSHSLSEAAAASAEQESSRQETAEQPEDSVLEYEIRDTPPNSHVEIVNEELLTSLKNRNYQELDAINERPLADGEVKTKLDECCSEGSEATKTRSRKSETFDISSSASGPSSSSDNLESKLNDLLDATKQK